MTGWLRRLHVTFPMTRGAAYSIVFLFVLNLVTVCGCLLWISHVVSHNKAVAAHQAEAQKRQGQVIERRLCATLHGLAALQPPSGSPADNPARGYEQAQHAFLSQLGPDVGCGAKTYPPASTVEPPVTSPPGSVVTGSRTPAPAPSAVPGPAGQPPPPPAPAPSPAGPAPVLSVSPPCMTLLIVNVCIGGHL